MLLAAAKLDVTLPIRAKPEWKANSTHLAIVLRMIEVMIELGVGLSYTRAGQRAILTVNARGPQVQC